MPKRNQALDQFERLTVKQAAAALGLSVASIKKFLYSGKLPGEKFGDVWVVYSRDLDLLRNRKTKPGPVKKAIKI